MAVRMPKIVHQRKICERSNICESRDAAVMLEKTSRQMDNRHVFITAMPAFHMYKKYGSVKNTPMQKEKIQKPNNSARTNGTFTSSQRQGVQHNKQTPPRREAQKFARQIKMKTTIIHSIYKLLHIYALTDPKPSKSTPPSFKPPPKKRISTKKRKSLPRHPNSQPSRRTLHTQIPTPTTSPLPQRSPLKPFRHNIQVIRHRRSSQQRRYRRWTRRIRGRMYRYERIRECWVVRS